MKGKKICLHLQVPPFTPSGGDDLLGRPIRMACFRNKLASLLKSQPWPHEYFIEGGRVVGGGVGLGG